jgi:hypothetical protein
MEKEADAEEAAAEANVEMDKMGTAENSGG